MRVLICGNRHWSDINTINNFLILFPRDTIIMHGGARGADKIADRIARKFGMTVIEFEADWDKYGNAAGPIRNQQMIDEGNPDLIVAFHSDIQASKGTKDMLKKALKYRIPSFIIQSTKRKI